MSIGKKKSFVSTKRTELYLCQCTRNCKGFSLEVPNSAPPCSKCGENIDVHDIALYGHLYRNTQGAQSGWFHLGCAEAVRTELASGGSYCLFCLQTFERKEDHKVFDTGNSSRQVLRAHHKCVKDITQLPLSKLRQLVWNHSINPSSRNMALGLMSAEVREELNLTDKESVKKARQFRNKIAKEDEIIKTKPSLEEFDKALEEAKKEFVADYFEIRGEWPVKNPKIKNPRFSIKLKVGQMEGDLEVRGSSKRVTFHCERMFREMLPHSKAASLIRDRAAPYLKLLSDAFRYKDHFQPWFNRLLDGKDLDTVDIFTILNEARTFLSGYEARSLDRKLVGTMCFEESFVIRKLAKELLINWPKDAKTAPTVWYQSA